MGGLEVACACDPNIGVGRRQRSPQGPEVGSEHVHILWGADSEAAIMMTTYAFLAISIAICVWMIRRYGLMDRD
jgi:hypothetical protein